MEYLTPNTELYGVPFSTDSFHGMPYRRLGRSGLRVSTVGLGTWKIGYPETGDGSHVNERTAFAIFDRALELGVTFWDTANRYNNASGNSERVIGKWFKARPDQRRNIVLATKVCGGMDGLTPNHGGLSRGCILDSVYACLARLQIDYIDLLYFHRFDPCTPVEESLGAVSDLIQRDLVRYFAVSNFTADQLRLYQAAEVQFSVRCRVLAVQNGFNILHGEEESCRGTLDYAAGNGISYVAWGPLAQGLLTERYIDPAQVGPGDRLYDEGIYKPAAGDEIGDTTMAKVRRLAELARAWGLPMSQLVLAYTLAIPGMGPVIPSSSTVEQLEMNAGAAKVELDAVQRESIRQVLEDPAVT